MKIDISAIDRTQFMVHDHFVGGELVHLIQPQHFGTQWRKDNKHLRSVVVNYEGEVISAGFPKFTNWQENPEHFPVPTSLNNCNVVEKLDGSLLIVSKYKGNYILRTRGTVDAYTLSNGYELDIFKEKILSKLHNDVDTWNYSVLFEWVSPVNKIVLNYGEEPDWHLVGFVNHINYSLAQQDLLDAMAKKYDLKRPTTYSFPSVEQLLKDVELWKNKEGVCVYSHNDQNIHKCKSQWYLSLHYLKSELSNVEKVLDVWLERGMPDYQTFYNYISTTFDYELAEQVKGMISCICDAKKEVDKIVWGMNLFVNTRLNFLPTRKQQAELTIASYGSTNRAAFIFKLLDGKPLGKEEYKKLMFQVLKK
jgi:hypothetical protein